MSLLHPTLGEMLDRFTVLTLKIHAYESKGRSSESLISEQHEISKVITERFGKKAWDILQSGDGLHWINNEIWKMEDSIRYTDEGTVEHTALVAKRIAYLNDERNRLIREIDKAYGCENPVEEKIYSKGG